SIFTVCICIHSEGMYNAKRKTATAGRYHTFRMNVSWSEKMPRGEAWENKAQRSWAGGSILIDAVGDAVEKCVDDPAGGVVHQGHPHPVQHGGQEVELAPGLGFGGREHRRQEPQTGQQGEQL